MPFLPLSVLIADSTIFLLEKNPKLAIMLWTVVLALRKEMTMSTRKERKSSNGFENWAKFFQSETQKQQGYLGGFLDQMDKRFEDLKESSNNRFEDMNNRFDDLKRDMDKRFGDLKQEKAS